MDFDAYLPRWQPDNRAVVKEGMAKIDYQFGGYNGPPMRKTSSGAIVVVPPQRYERAIDPAGNIVPVVVASNRVDREDSGYGYKVMHAKAKNGFLFVDDVPHGKTLAQHHADCLKIAEERKAAHAAAEIERAKNFVTAAQSQIQNTAEAIGKSIAAALNQRDAEPRKAK